MTRDQSTPHAIRQRWFVQAFLQGSTECIEIIDLQGKTLYLNEAASKRASRSGLISGAGVRWLSTWPSAAAEALTASLSVSSAGAAHRVQVECSASSIQSWWEVVTSPVREDSGEIIGHLAVTREITEEKQQEIRLAESERKLTTLVNNLPGAAYRSEPHPPWRMCYVSGGVEDLTGYKVDHFMSGAGAWGDLIVPEDAEKVEAEVATALEERRSFSIEYRIRHRSGAVRWVHERGQLVGTSGEAGVALEGFIGDVTDLKATELALTESEEHYRYTVELNPQISWVADADGQVVSFGDRWAKEYAQSKDQAAGIGWLSAVHPDDIERVVQEWQHSVRTGRRHECEYRLRLGNGAYEWNRARSAPLRDQDGRILRWYGTIENVHDRVSAELALKKSEELLRVAQEAGQIGSFTLDVQSGVVTCSPTLLALYGLPSSPTRRSVEDWVERIHPDDRVRRLDEMRLGLSGPKHFESRFRIVRADGAVRWIHSRVGVEYNPDGTAKSTSGIQQDITEQKQAEDRLQESEARARHMAQHDALTGLPNRALFNERLVLALREAPARGAQIALLHLDIDHFKQLNDSLGHDAGDELLKVFGDRLSDGIREDDFAARLGGDEFAVVLAGIRGNEDLKRAVASIMARLKQPFAYSGKLLDCRATIGASLFPRHGSTPDELLKCADIALYLAKSGSRGSFNLFEKSMARELRQLTSKLEAARSALSEGRISPFYQPKVDLSTGEVLGFEALLRWRDKTRNLHAPEGIAPAFEDVELATRISDRMVELTTRDARIWLDQGIEFGHVALNASAAEFRGNDFAEKILAALDRHSIPHDKFQVEVTETVFLGRGSEHVARALRKLDSCGVRVALDDFGTGYASLRHLKEFPVDTIKIDRSFVRDMETDPNDEAIIRAVINLGQSLNLRVIAEGVETRSQALRLMDLGCSFGQGYLFAKALPADRVSSFVNSAGTKSIAEAA